MTKTVVYRKLGTNRVPLRAKHVCEDYRLSPAQFARLRVSAGFPDPVVLPTGGKRWFSDELDRYFDNLPRGTNREGVAA